MSIEALRWAMRQKSRNSATQCVLLVLANAADPEGLALAWWKGRDHWWPYLMDKTRLSRGALFRILNELEDLGYFTRTKTKPQEGGQPQPVIQLHIERDVMEPERPVDSHSTAVTGEVARTPVSDGSYSTPETQNQSMPETDDLPPVTLERLPESPLATARDVPLKTLESPQSPPLAKPRGSEEPNGFAVFWSEYPDHQAMNRKRAMEAFNKLAEIDQQLAIKTVSFYARDIAKLKRRPVSPSNWLSERRFSEYGSGRQSSASGGGIQIVAEGSEPWKAWCNVAAVTYGGIPKIPYHWGAQGQRGAWRPTLWPLGGEAWLVPLDRWIFVESGTAQHGRWCERIQEMLDRAPIPIRLSSVKASRAIQANDQGRDAGRDPQGLFVPLEWPPPKGTGQQKTEHAA